MKIKVLKHDQSFVKIYSESNGIYNDISEFFSFEVPGAKYMPKFQSGMWDGFIRLFNSGTKLLPFGLVARLEKWAIGQGYEFETYSEYFDKSSVPSFTDFKAFVSSLELTKEPRDYQLACAYECMQKRKLIQSPTSSGKSLIIYLVIMAAVHFYGYDRFLIVVPTIQLVNQLKRDFEDYSNSSMSHLVHEISGGVEKDSEKPIVISTWQSLYKQPESWFSRTSEHVGFDALICDEVHGFASDCTKALVEKSKHIECKLGFSGTLSNSKVGELVLTGLFGDVFNAITTKQLIDNGQIANIKVYGIPLNWNVDCKKIVYQDEIKAIVVNRNRNKIIAKLAIGQSANSLMLFNEIEHLNNLKAELIAIDSNRANKIFVVTGATPAEYRTKVSLLCEKVDGIIILATYQVFQQGISINNLHNLFLVRPSKSTIRILQSIGRILRLNNNKDVAKVFDFFDIIVKTKNGDGSNTTFQHFKERYKTYIKQKFNVVIMPKVNLHNKINIE